MDKMNEIIKATVKANDEIKKFTDKIKNQSEIFDIMNLKLYSVSNYIYKNMENDFPNVYNSGYDYFENFCNDNYLFFEEWAKEEFIDLRNIMKYIGHSSSFYLSNNIADYFNTSDGVNGEVVINAVSEFGNFCTIDNFIKNDKFEINEIIINEWLTDYVYSKEEFLKDMNYELLQVSDIIQDIKNELEEIVKVYQYIKDFKENQIEYFKEYISFYEEELKELKEEELKKEVAKNKVLESVKSIIADDILTYDNYKFKIDLI